jgi:alkylhydroperoxidase family enzyme
MAAAVGVAALSSIRQHAAKPVTRWGRSCQRRVIKMQGTNRDKTPMSKPRISYVDPAAVKDPAMIAEFERCAREGTPRPESQAIRAHVPPTFWSFANTWRDVFKNGVAEHAIKELCRVYVSRSVLCEFCGNQRSIKAANGGLKEDDYSDLINFESSARYDERQKAALAYAEAITWDLPAGDELWARLNKHFSEAELVEIGYFVAITMGQQRWLRTLNIEHHQILAGQDGSMAPGYETEEALKRTKAAPDYWAKKKPQVQAAE